MSSMFEFTYWFVMYLKCALMKTAAILIKPISTWAQVLCRVKSYIDSASHYTCRGWTWKGWVPVHSASHYTCRGVDLERMGPRPFCITLYMSGGGPGKDGSPSILHHTIHVGGGWTWKGWVPVHSASHYTCRGGGPGKDGSPSSLHHYTCRGWTWKGWVPIHSASHYTCRGWTWKGWVPVHSASHYTCRGGGGVPVHLERMGPRPFCITLYMWGVDLETMGPRPFCITIHVGGWTWKGWVPVHSASLYMSGVDLERMGPRPFCITLYMSGGPGKDGSPSILHHTIHVGGWTWKGWVPVHSASHYTCRGWTWKGWVPVPHPGYHY